MAPIRVGLIGLAAADTPGRMGSWGVFAHLRSIQALSEFELVAVANSSVDSAQRSIDFHKLPATVKAYGNPEDIAADANVDLIVVSVKVSKHLSLAMPALEHKKSVFVEWPLGASVAEAEKLTRIASAQGVRTMVGLQGRFDPLTQKVKEILASGKIGKVTSSTVTICTSFFPMTRWVKGAEFYLDITGGGSEFVILFGHFLDTFTYLLGDFVTVQSLLKSHYPTVPILDTSTGIVVKAYPKTAPDHIFLQGELENGALASLAYRKPGSCVDKTGFRWYISGVEGEILITTDEKAWQSPSSPSTRSIKVRSGNKEGEAEVINFTPDDDYLASNVPPPGTNTARQYEAFARGGEIVTFESSLKTHRLLEKIANSAGLSLS